MEPKELLAHADFVRALSRRLVLDEHHAADLSQETLLAAIEHPPSKIKSVKSWFSGVIRNLAGKFRRSEARFTRQEREVALSEEVPSAEEIAALEESFTRVVEAVQNLDEPYRSTVLLRYYKDLSPREVAQVQDIPLETVRTRLKRGLAKLRQKLDKEFGDRGAWCLALAPLAGLKVGAKAATAGVAASTVSTVSGGLIMATKVKVGIAAVLVVFAATIAIIWHGGWLPESDKVVYKTDESLEIYDVVDEKEGSGDVNHENGTDETSTEVALEKVAVTNENLVTVKGRIVDETGQPLMGVQIEETSVNSMRPSDGPPKDALWTITGGRTGADGSAVIRVPRSQSSVTFLRFIHLDYRPSSVALYHAKVNSEGTLILDDIVLERGFMIKGRVVDHGGNPVNGCSVSTSGWSTWGTSTATNQDGQFQLNLPRNNPVVITALLENYGMGWSPDVLPGRGYEIPEVTITLLEGKFITGQIFYGDGTPATGQKIDVQAEIDGYPFKQSFIAEKEGRFRCFPLPAGLFDIVVRLVGVPGNVGLPEDHILLKSVASGSRDLRLILPSGSRLVIALADQKGEPVLLEPKVTFSQLAREEPDQIGQTHCGYRWSGEVEHLGPGIFGYRNIIPGTFNVGVRIEGFAYKELRDIVVPEPPDDARVDVVLGPERQITGTIRWSDGSPACGVRVVWEFLWGSSKDESLLRASFDGVGVRTRSERYRGAVTMTDESGEFAFRNLVRCASYYLYFSVADREVLREFPVKVTDENPQVNLDLSLPETDGSIEGYIYSQSKPLAGAVVVAWNGDDFFYKTRSEEDGRYVLEGIPDGRYVVDARVIPTSGDSDRFGMSTPFRKGFEDLENLNPYNAVIVGGEAINLNLHISDPWNSIVSGWIDGGGRSLPEGTRVSVGAFREETYDHREHRPNAADLFHYPGNKRDLNPKIEEFRFEKLRAGRCRVEVSWGDTSSNLSWRSDPFDLAPSAHVEIPIKLALSDIGGIVRGKTSGEEVSNARVVLMPSEEGQRFSRHEMVTGKDGSFSERNLPASTYDLIIRHDEYAPFVQRKFQLVANIPQDGLRFELDPGNEVKGRIVSVEGEVHNPSDYYIYPSIPPLGTRWDSRDGKVAKDGTFVVKGLPSGKVVLVVQYGAEPVTERMVELPLADDEEVVIEVPLTPP